MHARPRAELKETLILPDNSASPKWGSVQALTGSSQQKLKRTDREIAVFVKMKIACTFLNFMADKEKWQYSMA